MNSEELMNRKTHYGFIWKGSDSYEQREIRFDLWKLWKDIFYYMILREWSVFLWGKNCMSELS